MHYKVQKQVTKGTQINVLGLDWLIRCALRTWAFMAACPETLSIAAMAADGSGPANLAIASLLQSKDSGMG